MADIESGATAPTAAPIDADLKPLERTFRLESLVKVRHEVETYSRVAGLADIRLYKFVMAVNEIMTNAVHHGGGSGELRVWHDDVLHCQVTDHGRGIPPDRIDGHHRPEPGTIGGWGLWLTRQICDQMKVSTGPDGTEITLHFAIVPPEGQDN